ncbi:MULTISPECIES: thermonuclease family protein [unclassified Desulfovibrio]|uniref:thermonuclease family protein n=1 Tax=unclassified Desulfovibrio TaxID=2593640 RepID=UPI001F153C9C|nr:MULTISPECIES: thermonuclease family protein [unclassified Desulfovibrio]
MRLSFLAALLVTFLGAHAALAWEAFTPRKTTAYVVEVEEGNLIAVASRWGKKSADYTISLYGIGMPAEDQPFGKEARETLLRLLPRGERVIVSIVGEGAGVVHALVQAQGRSINNLLVDEGLAWVDRATCKAMLCRRWHIEEHSAIKDRRGIWSLNMTSPPWQWGGKTGTPAQAAPRGMQP